MIRTFRASALACVAVIVATGYSATYTLTDLGANTWAYGINNIGTIVGYNTVSGTHACYWVGGVRTNIPNDNYGGVPTRAMSVNDINCIVGTTTGSMRPPSPPTHASSYTNGTDAFTFYVGDT